MISLYNLTLTSAVVLFAAGETKSLHSPRVMEAMKITTVVTRHTSRLSSTLSIMKSPLKKKKKKENDIRLDKYSLLTANKHHLRMCT